MPIYQGGKAKIGNDIFEFIDSVEKKLEWKGEYFEPFCGLLGVGIHFANKNRKVIANDINSDLILLLKAIKRGWIPPKRCSKKKYLEYKNNEIHSAERGFYGLACSYSGIFYTGYRIKSGERDFFNTFRDGLIEMRKPLKNVKFINKSYNKFNPVGMTIYCDPPYLNNGFSTKHFNNFDFELFWETMRQWSKNNIVFVSEYQAPDDFTCVWERNIKSGFIGETIRKERVEKLFMYI